jgi:hypothetical protein
LFQLCSACFVNFVCDEPEKTPRRTTFGHTKQARHSTIWSVNACFQAQQSEQLTDVWFLTNKGSKMKQLVVATALCVVSMAWSVGAVAKEGSWGTTLQARDLNNDGVADAYYDTLQNITWLDNYDDGTAGERARDLLSTPLGPKLNKSNFWGIGDWTVPTGVAATSQLQVLWRNHLGNSGALTQTGPFKKIVTVWDSVWTSDFMRVTTIVSPFTEPVGHPDPNGKELINGIFSFRNGQLMPFYYGTNYGITPIHTGDVGKVVVTPVPEPGTWTLTLIGLIGMLAWRRFKKA